MTREREEALFVYAYCMLMMSKTKRKHLRIPRLVLDHVQQRTNEHWQYLTGAERLSFLFCLNERDKLDTIHTGTKWKLVVSIFWLKDKCAHIAADFVIQSDKRLN